MTCLKYLNDKGVALYERDAICRFTCKICEEPGFVETDYEALGVCADCVRSLAHAFVMKHEGVPDVRFSPPLVYQAFLVEEKARRASKKKPIPANLRRQCFERDLYRCRRCETHLNLEADHIMPEAIGGPTVLDNLQTLCKTCNCRKGARIAA